MREIEGVTDVSYDVSDSVTVSYQANTTSFEAELLSEAYIQEVYGITQEDSTMTYYANNAAYKQICQSLSQDIAPIQTEELTVTYTSSTEQSQNANQPTDSGNDASQAGDSVPRGSYKRISAGTHHLSVRLEIRLHLKPPGICASGLPDRIKARRY